MSCYIYRIRHAVCRDDLFSLPPTTSLHHVIPVIVPNIDLLLPTITAQSHSFITSLLQRMHDVIMTSTSYVIPPTTTSTQSSPYHIPLPTSYSADGEIIQYGMHLLLSYILATDSQPFLETLITHLHTWKSLIFYGLLCHDISIRCTISHYLYAMAVKISDTYIGSTDIPHMTFWYIVFPMMEKLNEIVNDAQRTYQTR